MQFVGTSVVKINASSTFGCYGSKALNRECDGDFRVGITQTLSGCQIVTGRCGAKTATETTRTPPLLGRG